jgi:hypothetical protein
MSDPTAPPVEKPAVEGKVWAATIGAGAGSAISAFLLWLLGVTIWHVQIGSDTAADAVAAVPFPVSGILTALITVGGAFISGYLAKHTHRPDLAPVDVPVLELPEEHDAGLAPSDTTMVAGG